MNFIWRISYIDKEGVCIIGMEKKAMMPLIIFEVIVNVHPPNPTTSTTHSPSSQVYLTLLFILPLRSISHPARSPGKNPNLTFSPGLYSYKNNANPKLNRMAFRSFIGSCATLTTSVANLSVLMVLKGEPGWICLMCCNADILFCVLVLHWVTSHDRPTTFPSIHATADGKRCSRALGTDSASAKEHEGDVQVRVRAECAGESLDGRQDRPGRVVQKKEGTWEGEEGGDEVELRKIHVLTCQTREVEGMEMSGGGGASISEDGHWAEDKISVERIV
jgi:hypothetical protein